MSTRMQVVLLRFLESGEIQRVGADRSHTRVNVRLITATNRDLEKEIQSGAFREDLYFRLNVIRFSIPPLRERAEDVPLLVRHYSTAFSQTHKVPATGRLASDAMDALMAYRWPGNVRELKNVVERIVLKAAGRPVRAADLPPEVLRTSSTVAAGPGAADLSGGRLGEATLGNTARADELASAMIKQGESFWSAVYPDLHVPGSDTNGPAPDRSDRARDDERQLSIAGAALQHGAARLQALPELSAEARLPSAVPAVSSGAGQAATGAGHAAGVTGTTVSFCDLTSVAGRPSGPSDIRTYPESVCSYCPRAGARRRTRRPERRASAVPAV